MNERLKKLLEESRKAVEAMTPEARAEMFRKQREGYVKAEASWPKPKFKWVDGVKVYDSYGDYCNG